MRTPPANAGEAPPPRPPAAARKRPMCRPGLFVALGGLIMLTRIRSNQATFGTAMEVRDISRRRHRRHEPARRPRHDPRRELGRRRGT